MGEAQISEQQIAEPLAQVAFLKVAQSRSALELDFAVGEVVGVVGR